MNQVDFKSDSVKAPSQSPQNPSHPNESDLNPKPNQSFDKSLRLLKKSDFDRVFQDAPIRASHQHLLILTRRNDLGYPRLGLVVAKKHVKLATGRNLIKRITRESFRQEQGNLPSIDAIVLARRGIDTLSARELRQILDNLWKRIKKKANASA